MSDKSTWIPIDPSEAEILRTSMHATSGGGDSFTTTQNYSEEPYGEPRLKIVRQPGVVKCFKMNRKQRP